MILDLIHLVGTAAFVIEGGPSSLSRVYGATEDRTRSGTWYMPAYPPFASLVIADLAKVMPNLVRSPAVVKHLAYIESVPQQIHDKILPEGFDFVTQPFEHQREIFIKMLHYPRIGLLWDPGCGKTKPVVDFMRYKHEKPALITCPRIALFNWVEEISTHSGGMLRAAAMSGTPEQKLATMRRYKELDALVVTYATARNMGTPRLQPRTLLAMKKMQAVEGVLAFFINGLGGNYRPRLNDAKKLVAVARTVRPLSAPDDQIKHVQAWVLGRPLAQVDRDVKAAAALEPQWLCDIPYDKIVADESHALADLRSAQTKAVLALSLRATYRAILSGTPDLGDPRNLRGQLRFLSPALCPEDDIQFSNKFLVKSPWNTRIVTGFKNMDIMNARVGLLCAKKTKDECLDLPPRTPPIDIKIRLEGTQLNLYNTLVSAMEVDLDSFFEGGSGEIAVQSNAILINKLSQVRSGFIIDPPGKKLCDTCPHVVRCVAENILPYTKRCMVAKVPPATTVRRTKENAALDALSDLLETLLADTTKKVIIWGYFHEELKSISKLLDNKKLGYVRLDGNTADQAHDLKNKFNNDPTCRVFLGQESMGESITLNAAEYMVYFSYDWSLRSWLQSIDRNYRAGQTKKVFVYRLVVEGSIDEYKIKALDLKKDISASLSNKIACTTCVKRIECLENGVELYDPACLYKRSVRRSVAHAKVINEDGA